MKNKRELIIEMVFVFIILVSFMTLLMWITSFETIRQGMENMMGSLQYYGLSKETFIRVVWVCLLGTPILVIPLHISNQRELEKGDYK